MMIISGIILGIALAWLVFMAKRKGLAWWHIVLITLADIAVNYFLYNGRLNEFCLVSAIQLTTAMIALGLLRKRL